MPLSTPDFRHRAQLPELMDEPCTRDQLRGCLRDIARINRWTFAARPVLRWLDSVLVDHHNALPVPLRILDVGCGYGDGLRRIEQWASARQVAVELIGLDLNPDAAAIAREATPANSRIQWLSTDIFEFSPAQPIHLVTSSLFTHHLSDADIVRFLRWMEQHTVLAWFINDLSRAPIPYHVIKSVAKLARLHPFVQYDAPVSVARAFIRQDWQALIAAAGLYESDAVVEAFKPARLCVSRCKPTWSVAK